MIIIDEIFNTIFHIEAYEREDRRRLKCYCVLLLLLTAGGTYARNPNAAAMSRVVIQKALQSVDS